MADTTKSEDEKRAEFRESYQRIHEHWTNTQFYSKRNTWNTLIDRTFKTQVDDFLKPYAQGIDIQSYVAEKDRGIHIQILTLDEPRFDTISLDDSATQPAPAAARGGAGKAKLADDFYSAQNRWQLEAWENNMDYQDWETDWRYRYDSLTATAGTEEGAGG